MEVEEQEEERTEEAGVNEDDVDQEYEVEAILDAKRNKAGKVGEKPI
jgi:hypothetical protein